MARPVTISREEVVRRIKKAFRANGYEGASLATLAAETGLAKSALYHYFPGGKESMAAAALDELRRWTADRVLEPLLQPGDPRRKLEALAAALDELYSGGHEACLVGLFSIGEALAHFQGQLQASFRSLIAAIAGVLAEAGLADEPAHERAEDAVIRIQGSLVVARTLGDCGPFSRLLRRLPDDLLAGCASGSPPAPTR